MGLDDRDYMKPRWQAKKKNHKNRVNLYSHHGVSQVIFKKEWKKWQNKHRRVTNFIRKIPDAIGYITIIYLIYGFSTGGFTLTDSAAGHLKELDSAIFKIRNPELSSSTYQINKSMKSFDDINKFRQDNLKFKILWSEDVYNLAKFRAEDMVKRRYFSHITPDGKDVSDYLGYYNFYLDSSWGENICQNCNNPTTDWINSPRHQEILLTGWGKGAVACESNICVFIGVTE